MIEIKNSDIHGKGVFSTEYLPAGTLLVCDVIVFPKDIIIDSVYRYPWYRDDGCICAGFGSFLNHSNEPNIVISSIDKKNLTKTFKTILDINMGCEILMKYM